MWSVSTDEFELPKQQQQRRKANLCRIYRTYLERPNKYSTELYDRQMINKQSSVLSLGGWFGAHG